MKFRTTGNPNGRKALLVHAMFVTPDIFSALIEYLKKDFYFILPTLDGHDPEDDTVFLSVEDEAEKIIDYLRNNDIRELDFIMGTSLGAIIAFEVYRRDVIHIGKAYLDGGPFFSLAPLIRRFAGGKFWNICNDMRSDPQNTVKKMERLFPGLGGMMLGTCGRITKESALNLAHACYSFPLPDLSEAMQRAIFFQYGTKEPARFCIFRLRRYKSSNIIKRPGYHHCGYLLSHPEEYAAMLKDN